MTSQRCLNSVGLGLGMLGVVILFFYGPPQPNLESGVGLGLEDATPLGDGRTVADHNRDTERLRGRHAVLSKIGLGLVGIGFALQFVAVWLPT